MLFVSVEDFFTQASPISRLSRDEEKALAQRMAAGDQASREALRPPFGVGSAPTHHPMLG